MYIVPVPTDTNVCKYQFSTSLGLSGDYHPAFLELLSTAETTHKWKEVLGPCIHFYSSGGVAVSQAEILIVIMGNS